ncbi:MAG: bifunctional adenosylcobinamide kinase/adenosylcobinamide-phosphate guanylyltransferase [Oscillospiraceae bacterium]|nr:bifunctional adenosylcobinamide kinase/adenosylcobinamide-phosphate guanylyltransferase [Oscillospiraceae bacterium]
MRILLTGGAGSGKSEFAESLALAQARPLSYIAAMKPYGEESERRIARHRGLRAGKGFATIERYADMDSLILPTGGTALLECLCNLTANEMFDDAGAERDAGHNNDAVFEKIVRGQDALAAQCSCLIQVTNEVGRDAASYGDGTLRYIQLLGRINRALAARADAVYELVCGIPIQLKGTVV